MKRRHLKVVVSAPDVTPAVRCSCGQAATRCVELHEYDGAGWSPPTTMWCCPTCADKLVEVSA